MVELRFFLVGSVVSWKLFLFLSLIVVMVVFLVFLSAISGFFFLGLNFKINEVRGVLVALV